MRKIILIALCFLLLSPIVYAQQNSQAELQNLNRRIPALIEREDFDEVVAAAEKIVKIEKQGGEKNLANYAAALMNLALWKKQRLAKKPQVTLVTSFTQSAKVFLKESEEIEELFRELLAIFQNNLDDPARLASVQGELARFLFTSYVTREKIDEAGRLYEQSLALREKHLGVDTDSTLSMMLQLSEFYFQTGEFEKFLPLYQKLTSTTAKKFGENDKRLIPAWRLFSGFLITTDRRVEAIELLRKVSSLTGRGEVVPAASYSLLNRAASKINNTIGTPIVTYTRSSPLIMPNPTDVLRTRPTSPTATVTRPPTVSGSIVSGRLEVPTSISAAYTILVSVLIDESGSVIEAAPIVPNEKVKKEVAKKVLKWKFKPFAEDGVSRRMRGVVSVLYYKPIPPEKPKKEKKTRKIEAN
jgi:hypothetical protein